MNIGRFAEVLLAFSAVQAMAQPPVTAGPGPTAQELAVFERFATRASAQVTLLKQPIRIESGATSAVIAAVTVHDSTQTPTEARGIRVELSDPSGHDQVYISEEFGDRLAKGTEEVAAGFPIFASGRTAGTSRCFGAGAFISAVREGAHFFQPSECTMADGWTGVRVFTGTKEFRFQNVSAWNFAAAIASARDSLKQQQ